MIAHQQKIKTAISIFLILQICVWIYGYSYQARWLNVPPAPNTKMVSFGILGDKQLYFRTTSLMLQNLGDYGGRVTSLKEYNYDELSKWFILTDKLDSKSHFIPYLASYYFSAVQDTQKLFPLIKYLERAGIRGGDQDWRWIVQAAFLARYNYKDTNLALDIAKRLPELENKNIPIWAKQMPALILSDQGDKKAAYSIAVMILQTEGEKLEPTELNFIQYLICERILSVDEAKEDPICLANQ